MKTLLIALMLAMPAGAFANVVSTETKTVTLTSTEQLDFTCTPGVAPHPGNYPTSSDVELYNIDTVIPETNVRQIGMMDPHSRLGNHCAELQQEFQSILPAKLTITRTLTQRAQWDNGVCVNELVEELVGKIGSYELVGDSAFVTGTIPNANCPE